MTYEPYTCDLDQESKTKLKVYLMKNVKNIEEVRSNVIKGVWSCAVVKPSLILDPLQLAVAANRAVVARQQASMVTRTVFGEILFNLSLSKNISQSLTKFGVEKEQDILICFLTTPEEDNSSEIVQQIQGELCPLSELSTFTNMREVKSVYKLNNLKGNPDFLDVILSRMATKSFVSH